MKRVDLRLVTLVMPEPEEHDHLVGIPPRMVDPLLDLGQRRTNTPVRSLHMREHSRTPVGSAIARSNSVWQRQCSARARQKWKLPTAWPKLPDQLKLCGEVSEDWSNYVLPDVPCQLVTLAGASS